MLTSLINLRLSGRGRKRGSDAMEDNQRGSPSPAPSASASAPVSVTDSPARPMKSLPNSPAGPSRHKKARSRSRVRAPTPPPDSPEKAALDALKHLVRSCPPKSFHANLLKRLDGATPEQVSVLSTLLEGLEPPPVLHCSRCHQDYLEEENADRSCVMHHDDDSVTVEYGETTWGCCDNTTEGQEPPAGWCYEGRHTVRC